jgi:ribosomal protein L11 methylase PrmA
LKFEVNMRLHPALALTWPVLPDTEEIDRMLAEIDVYHPTAIEDIPGGVRVFFASAIDREQAAALLAGFEPNAASTIVDVPDEDWAARSQASLGTVRVGRVIVGNPTTPSGDRAADGALFISIAPSMGFGTGHHGSTRACLELLQHRPVTGARVLDVGTGSGILGIAAWRLGASAVIAVDADPDALAAAHDNLTLNDAVDAVALYECDVAACPSQVSGGRAVRRDPGQSDRHRAHPKRALVNPMALDRRPADRQRLSSRRGSRRACGLH